MLLNKILVAEDDDSIAHMVNMALGDAGFLCLRARNGEEAINLAKVQSPDCLILDIMMPRCDGMQVVKFLRSDPCTSRTPILMLTALGGVNDKVSGLEAGADDYLTKPFDLRELAARVKALVRASRRERDRDPTTGLPGSNAINETLAELLMTNPMSNAAVMHIDVHGFDVYADQVGFAKAQQFAQALGGMLVTCVRSIANEVFVGHLGGVDFIVICDADAHESVARDIIAGFGDVQGRGDDTSVQQLSLAIGIVQTVDLDTGQRLETGVRGDLLAKRLAAALRESKQRVGSNHVLWQSEL